MTRAEIAHAVEQVTWWHRIDLGQGIITPGVDDSPAKLRGLQMPASLQGLSVLDIGAWDGFFSFEAERRGAARVVAADLYSWEYPRFNRAGFQLAKKVLQSNVEEIDLDVMEMNTSNPGVFDVVLFMGVLYHMRHPLLALERVFEITRQLLILETHVTWFHLDKPAMVFYPHAELNGDPTNWWGPNPPAVRDMLLDVGFKNVKAYPPYSPDRMAFHATK